MSTSANPKLRTFSEIIEHWFVNSPSHGIRRIGQAKTLTGRLFWGYSSWIFTILMGCFIHSVITNYIAHPTRIHLAIRPYRYPEHFPAITFCNVNPLKDDGFVNDKKKNTLRDSNSSEVNKLEYRKIVSAYLERILAAQVNGEQHPLIQWGFQLHDLLITCTFNNKLCHENLTQSFHPDYGNCYTFDNNQHVQNDKIPDMRSDWSIDEDHRNENYKLFLELYLHQRDYNEFLDQRAAFRLFIHRKQEIPMLSENSLLLGPNKYTELSFLPRVMSFSRQCRTDLTTPMKQIFPIEQVRYTQALCYKFCEHRFIMNQCRCIEQTSAVFYQFFNDKFKKINNSLCSIDDLCLKSRGYFNASQLCPECLPACEIIQYSIQSSHAYYPNYKAHSQVLERVHNHFRLDRRVNDDLRNITDGSSSNRRTKLMDNIVAVEISASPYATEILTETPVYSWVDLISNIGGQTSLWIGISLISLLEIMGLFYSLFDRFCPQLFFCNEKSN